MNRFIKLVLLVSLAHSVFAQNVPAPQIGLSGNVGGIGFPILNSGPITFTSDADMTLTLSSTDTSAVSAKITSAGNLTATRTIYYPAGRFRVAFENATMGGQAINICGPSGICATIPNDPTHFYDTWNDGAKVVQGSAGSAGFASPPPIGNTTPNTGQFSVLNSTYNATSYLSGGGNNGIQNALNAAFATSGGGAVEAPYTYPGVEPFYSNSTYGDSFTMPNSTTARYFRGGHDFERINNPFIGGIGNNNGEVWKSTECDFSQFINDPNYNSEAQICTRIHNLATYPGYNLGNYGGWTGATPFQIWDQNFTSGISQELAIYGNISRPGDFQFINTGGLFFKTSSMAASDQGTYTGMYSNASEEPAATGTITGSTSTAGSSSVTLTPTNNNEYSLQQPLLDVNTMVSCTASGITVAGGVATVTLSGGAGCTSSASISGQLQTTVTPPQQANNYTNAPSLMSVTLTGLSSLLSVGQVVTWAGGSWIETAKITSLVSSSGSAPYTQTVMMPLRYIHLATEQACVGGLAGWFYDQPQLDSADGNFKYMHRIVCSLSSSTVQVTSILAAGHNAQVFAGVVHLYNGATVTLRQTIQTSPTTQAVASATIGVEDSTDTWTVGDSTYHASVTANTIENQVSYETFHNPYGGYLLSDEEPTGNALLGLYGYPKPLHFMSPQLDPMVTGNYISGTTAGSGVEFSAPIIWYWASYRDIASMPFFGAFNSDSAPVNGGYLTRFFGEYPGATVHYFDLFTWGDIDNYIRVHHDTQELELQFASVRSNTSFIAGNYASAGFREVLFTPASSSAACTAGDFTDDTNYHYVCTATNNWRRVALSSF